MTRLINADDIPYVTDETYLHEYDYAYRYAIDAMPTVDAVPVVHGKWKCVSIDRYACSVCCCEPYYAENIGTLRYCPNCGARMDAE